MNPSSRTRDAPLVTLGGERQAHFSGFDLHANVAVPAGDRSRLERLALRASSSGRAGRARAHFRRKVLLTMRRAWHDGTRAVLFEPHELIEKLAALVPRPRINLLLYHGVLGPSARLRSRAVGAASSLRALESGDDARPTEDAPSTRPETPAPVVATPPSGSIGGSLSIMPPDPVQPPRRSHRLPRPHTPWAELLRRTFEIDVLACPECNASVGLRAQGPR